MEAIFGVLLGLPLYCFFLAVRILISLGIGYLAFWISTFFDLQFYMPLEGVPYSAAFMIGAVVGVLSFIGPFFSSSS